MAGDCDEQKQEDRVHLSAWCVMERQPDQSVPGDKQCRAGWASRRADWADIDLKGNTNIAPSPNDLCRRGEGKKKKRKKKKKETGD